MQEPKKLHGVISANLLALLHISTTGEFRFDSLLQGNSDKSGSFISKSTNVFNQCKAYLIKAKYGAGISSLSRN